MTFTNASNKVYKVLTITIFLWGTKRKFGQNTFKKFWMAKKLTSFVLTIGNVMRVIFWFCRNGILIPKNLLAGPLKKKLPMLVKPKISHSGQKKMLKNMVIRLLHLNNDGTFVNTKAPLCSRFVPRSVPTTQYIWLARAISRPIFAKTNWF